MKLLRVLVVGTGTKIGKTHVTTCLLSYARAQGRRVHAYKPIASGIAERCGGCSLIESEAGSR